MKSLCYLIAICIFGYGFFTGDSHWIEGMMILILGHVIKEDD